MARRRALAVPPVPALIVQHPAGDPTPAPAPASTTPPVQDVVVHEAVQITQEAVQPLTPFQAMLGLAGALLGAYHGARRNGGSVMWGIAWGAAGGVAPVITTGIALAQGYGRPRGAK